MILPNCIIHELKSKFFNEYGIDSLELQKEYKKDVDAFLNYPYKISYKFNDRGFRDNEWPTELQDLKKRIWCIGDSFTVGIGNPITHIWPYLLGNKLNQQTINVSMCGASNQWIAARVIEILDEIRPDIICIHWTFTHRRQSESNTNNYLKNRIWYTKSSWKEDLEDTISQISKVELIKEKTFIVHSFVPLFHGNVEYALNQINKKLPKCITTNYLIFHDTARDNVHYDIRTAEVLVNEITKKLNAPFV